MLYCPFCSSLLVPEKKAAGNCLSCKLCSYNHTIQDPITRTSSLFSKKKNENLVVDEETFKFAQVCEETCKKCGNCTAMFYEMQTRGADEPMTVFYKCTTCMNVWRE